MLAFALVVVLAQTPPPVIDAEVNAADLESFSRFVDKHLLSVSAAGQVRASDRAWRLSDDDFEAAFTLVPEARELARVAHDEFVTASHFDHASLVLLGLSMGVVLAAAFLPAVAIPLLVASMVGLVVALALTLVALPIAMNANERFLNSVSVHNHGLLDLRSVGGQVSFGGMTLAR